MVGVCSPFSIKTVLCTCTQITNNSGNLAAEYSYDAWGRMRNPANWNVYSTTAQPTLLFGRGYTGHEHLNQFGLINMNARLYDPLLARFLAPDPFVNSGMTNDFNRYVYCRDNPMMYTDPDGKWSFEIGWGTGSKPGAFYRGSYGNSSLYGNYNTNTSTFTMGSTYYGYQTSNVIYQGQNQYTQSSSLSNALVGHYFSTYTAVWMANANTIRADLTSTRHNVYADYSFGLTNGNGQNGSDILTPINSTLGIVGIFGGPIPSTLGTGLTGYTVYKQYKDGGKKNVNPADVTSFVAGATSVAVKLLSWFKVGGEIAAGVGGMADGIGTALTIYELWGNIYKPMNDLRFAPSYIDPNKNPFYGDPCFDNPTNEEHY